MTTSRERQPVTSLSPSKPSQYWVGRSTRRAEGLSNLVVCGLAAPALLTVSSVQSFNRHTYSPTEPLAAGSTSTSASLALRCFCDCDCEVGCSGEIAQLFISLHRSPPFVLLSLLAPLPLLLLPCIESPGVLDHGH